MKILAIGDSIFLPTGYGRVSKNVLSYFALKGHNVVQIGWGHSEPNMQYPVHNDGINAAITIVPPLTNDPFYTLTTINYINAWKPDIVYNSNDYFTMDPLLQNNDKLNHHPKLVQYGIIDGPMAARCYKQIIKKMDVPVVPSQYGFNQLKEITDKGIYIPHGVDTKLYNAYEPKEVFKTKLGVQGKFVFGCVNRNIWRKQYPILIRAFSRLKHEYHLRDIVLYLVCDPYDLLGNNIWNWAKMHDLTVSNRQDQIADIMLHPYILNAVCNLTDQQLVEAYNAFDVMVSTSMSEGFGLSTIEAMACGIPVVACDNTANTELVKGHGYLYSVAKNADGSPVLIPPTLKDIPYYYELPDQYSLEIAMLQAYNDNELREQNCKKSYDFAQQYDWNKVLPLWDEVLNRASAK
jgi:D-inositol-3-phosphate glycosyltransferase